MSQERIEANIANIKRERKDLRDQIEAYQKEFEQNNNRRIRYVRDIAPIDAQYRRYKELKNDLQKYEEMLNRWLLLTDNIIVLNEKILRLHHHKTVVWVHDCICISWWRNKRSMSRTLIATTIYFISPPLNAWRLLKKHFTIRFCLLHPTALAKKTTNQCSTSHRSTLSFGSLTVQEKSAKVSMRVNYQ